MRFLPVNLDCFLVELASLEQTLALFQSLQREPITGIEELLPAARTLLVRFAPWHIDRGRLIGEIGRRDLSPERRKPGKRVSIAVHYVGEDLDEVAKLLGISPQEVIRRHTAKDYLVAFCGFAPGFAYLSGGAGFQVPRRASPRTRIPAGAVALAGGFSGIYPKASPGGWQIIGITEQVLWDAGRPQPALLRPGYRVRFVDAGPAPNKGQPVTPAAPSRAPGDGRHWLEILRPGLQTSLQDGGRHGYADQGLGAAGAVDRGAWHAANRLVGNPPHSACLEVLLGGLSLRCHGQGVMAVTGAPAIIEIQSAGGRRWQEAPYRPFALEDGDRVSLGAPSAGLRSYLALRGGFPVAAVLGSRSWDSLGQIGPPPLAAGDRLAFAPSAAGSAVSLAETPAFAAPRAGDTVMLDLVMGPRSDWFSPESIRRLAGQSWQVTAQSNRIGIRLQGARPLIRAITDELPSEGVVRGALQVPADGQPILFLADHPVTGGYPVIGALAAHHLDLAGQLPTGTHIRFNPLAPFQEL